MPAFAAPTRDQLFVLHSLLRIEGTGLPGFDDLDRDFTSAILDEAGRLASDLLAPLNAVGDREGCTLKNGTVTTPTGFRAAFDEMRAGGWTAIDCAPEHGGQGLPHVIHTAVQEPFVSANMAFNMYQGLTHGAYSAIRAHGSDDQKALYLPRLASCEWTGTMNLTEPHCGTDLGLMRTRAEPQPDGSWRITGQKIFISAGDHDLADNIIHLVLARAPGGGEGTKGLSLFIVPKVLVNPDGSLGARNAVAAGKVEHKMGIHGNATCVMDYDGATGFLLGGLHKGMNAMFTMMNEARLGVGLQGYAVAEAAWQAALAHARDRLQGRAVGGARNPDGPADPLIVHPDIRRMLMDQKSFVEGARALTYWGALLLDRTARTDDPQAEALISLLTPVIKGFLTDKGFEMTVAAQQILGGHGYIEDNGLSQLVRDARIAMIYEGANGIQALDLVGRKLAQDGGQAFMGFIALVRGLIASAREGARLDAGLLDPLGRGLDDLQAAAMTFMENAASNPDAALAGSSDFLHMMGEVALGYIWVRAALAAIEAEEAGGIDAALREAKVACARHWLTRHVPATALHLARIRNGAASVLALDPDRF
ncbi:MAG: acyl-CoA dehydrogenase C-terminal domain-containing protein [Rubellimicrobium sp.]|nr:acyl-CoA dehydrogenase C-terminal domain-containing protein [Rubellimicrobium sp.]